MPVLFTDSQFGAESQKGANWGQLFTQFPPSFFNLVSLTFETPSDILCSIEIMTCVAIRVAIKMRSALYGQQKPHDQIKMQQMMKNYYASTKSFFVVPVPQSQVLKDV